MTVGIINPGSGNITSVCDSLGRLDFSFKVLEHPQLEGITQLLLPGQGRFGAVMRYLDGRQWTPVLRQWVADNKPLLGICAGMQVMFQSSDEDPGVEGLGFLPGRVRRLESPKQPMMGWARVHWSQGDYPEGAAYFVNSYVVMESDAAIGHTTYGSKFVCAVARGALTAFQFHPEKSGTWGKELMAKCLIS